MTLFSTVGSAAASVPRRIENAVLCQRDAARMEPGEHVRGDQPISDESAWGNPHVTKDFITAKLRRKASKAFVFRLHGISGWVGAPDYTIDPVFDESGSGSGRLVAREGLYVMINVHHDSWHVDESMATNHDAVWHNFKAYGRKSPTASRIIPTS